MFLKKYSGVLLLLVTVLVLAGCDGGGGDSSKVNYTFSIYPTTPTLAVGSTIYFRIKNDTVGSILDNSFDSSINWSVIGDIGTINSDGIFAATSVGSGQIKAVCNFNFPEYEGIVTLTTDVTTTPIVEENIEINEDVYLGQPMKLYKFLPITGQVYSIVTDAETQAYVGNSSNVSPTNYLYKTDNNHTSFVAASTNPIYILAITSNTNTGLIQVSDGGIQINVGFSAGGIATLDYTVFCFPINPNKNYHIIVSNPSCSNLAIMGSPSSHRYLNGTGMLEETDFCTVSANATFEKDIPSTWVSQSFSGFYYLSIGGPSTAIVVSVSEN